MSALLAGAATSVRADLNLQTPQTPIAAQIYDLHLLIMGVCVVIFIGVFGMMFYSILKHRKSVGHKAAHFHENTTVEVIWTVVPFLILMGMAYPATKTVIAMKDTSNPDLTIKATGYQWKWGYEYVKGEGDLAGVSDGIQFYSNLKTSLDEIQNQAPKGENYLLDVDEPLVVPVGKKVRILTTANDVIHAFWVPAFGVKQDAIPGFIRDTWFKVDQPGTYRGQCAELCGKEHGFMPIVVIAMEQAEFKAWADKRKVAAAPAQTATDAPVGSGDAAAMPTEAPAAEAAAAPEAPMQVAAAETKKADKPAAGGAKADGAKVYNGICVACHAAGVAGAPKVGDKAAWKARIAQGQATLHEHAIKGIRAMPAKGGNPALSDDEVKAAVDYMVAQSK
ncbi:MAG: cytochrome c oxidase subunit II [Burkholderiales bacterium]|nr:cytochrome c oxidase subunit II [Burkholderiales bacterium]